MPTQIQVQKGQNLTGIAKANNSTIADILKANPSIKDPNLIYAGSTVNIPGQTPAEKTNNTGVVPIAGGGTDASIANSLKDRASGGMGSNAQAIKDFGTTTTPGTTTPTGGSASPTAPITTQPKAPTITTPENPYPGISYNNVTSNDLYNKYKTETEAIAESDKQNKLKDIQSREAAAIQAAELTGRNNQGLLRNKLAQMGLLDTSSADIQFQTDLQTKNAELIQNTKDKFNLERSDLDAKTKAAVLASLNAKEKEIRDGITTYLGTLAQADANRINLFGKESEIAQTEAQNEATKNKPITLPDGSVLVDPTTGKPIYENVKNFANKNTNTGTGGGVQVNIPGSTAGGTPSSITKDTISAYESYILRNTTDKDGPAIIASFRKGFNNAPDKEQYLKDQAYSFIPQKAKETFDSAQSIELALTPVLSAIDSGSFTTGPFKNAANVAGRIIGKQDPYYESIKSLFSKGTAEERLRLFGASLTTGEKGSARDFLPDANDPTAVLKYKIETMIDTAKLIQDKAINQYLGLPTPTVQEYLASRKNALQTLKTGAGNTNQVSQSMTGSQRVKDGVTYQKQSDGSWVAI